MLVIFAVLLFNFQYTVLSKTPGQSLDDTILELKANLTLLGTFHRSMKEKYNRIERDIKTLKLSHDSCAPCKKAKRSTDNHCDCTEFEPKQDCLEFHQAGFSVNGIYRLEGPRFSPLNAFCDQKTMGGGWTVIQRRRDGSVDFNRNWNDYKLGFGKLIGELWFGNENIHDLTKPTNAPKKSELLINMLMKGKTKKVYAKYNTFQIGDEKSQYTLSVDGFSGNVSEHRMDYHNGQNFTTFDSEKNYCAKKWVSGWWYDNCYQVNLNGRYSFLSSYPGIYWDYNNRLRPEFVEMKLRRKL